MRGYPSFFCLVALFGLHMHVYAKLHGRCKEQDTCVGSSCQHWVNLGFKCSYLEKRYGCNCKNCPCVFEAPKTDTCTEKHSCKGHSCDYWVGSNENYTCGFLEADIGCKCDGCSCTFNHTCTNPTGCFGRSCAFWMANHHFTCNSVETTYGCDCSGCKCEMNMDTCEDATECQGRSCDFWVNNFNFACDDLEDDYGCKCKGCGCESAKRTHPCWKREIKIPTPPTSKLLKKKVSVTKVIPDVMDCKISGSAAVASKYTVTHGFVGTNTSLDSITVTGPFWKKPMNLACNFCENCATKKIWIGDSKLHSVTVDAKGVYSCSNKPANYMQPSWGDTFSVDTSVRDKLTVTRTDVKWGGWGAYLELTCIICGQCNEKMDKTNNRCTDYYNTGQYSCHELITEFKLDCGCACPNGPTNRTRYNPHAPKVTEHPCNDAKVCGVRVPLTKRQCYCDKTCKKFGDCCTSNYGWKSSSCRGSTCGACCSVPLIDGVCRTLTSPEQGVLVQFWSHRKMEHFKLPSREEFKTYGPPHYHSVYSDINIEETDEMWPGVRFDKDLTHDWRSRFMVRMSGCLSVPETGTYTIALTSDDGSRLYLDNKTVIDHGGRHSMSTAGKTMQLKAGEIPFELFYFENEGGAGLILSWRHHGAYETIGLVPIPDTQFQTKCGNAQCPKGMDRVAVGGGWSKEDVGWTLYGFDGKKRTAKPLTSGGAPAVKCVKHHACYSVDMTSKGHGWHYNHLTIGKSRSVSLRYTSNETSDVRVACGELKCGKQKKIEVTASYWSHLGWELYNKKSGAKLGEAGSPFIGCIPPAKCYEVRLKSSGGSGWGHSYMTIEGLDPFTMKAGKFRTILKGDCDECLDYKTGGGSIGWKQLLSLKEGFGNQFKISVKALKNVRIKLCEAATKDSSLKEDPNCYIIVLNLYKSTGKSYIYFGNTASEPLAIYHESVLQEDKFVQLWVQWNGYLRDQMLVVGTGKIIGANATEIMSMDMSKFGFPIHYITGTAEGHVDFRVCTALKGRKVCNDNELFVRVKTADIFSYELSFKVMRRVCDGGGDKAKCVTEVLAEGDDDFHGCIPKPKPTECYQVQLYDSYGDGWDNSFLHIGGAEHTNGTSYTMHEHEGSSKVFGYPNVNSKKRQCKPKFQSTTFQIDMSYEVVDVACGAKLIASFNGEDNDIDMDESKDRPGVWLTTVDVPIGFDVTYKFRNCDVTERLKERDTCTTTTLKDTYRQLVGAKPIIPLMTFNLCKHKPRLPLTRMTFKVDMSQFYYAYSVGLVGDITSPQLYAMGPSGYKMSKKNYSIDIFEVTLELRANTSLGFRFRNGYVSSWSGNSRIEHIPAHCYGSFSSRRIRSAVAGGPGTVTCPVNTSTGVTCQTVGPFCYGACKPGPCKDEGDSVSFHVGRIMNDSLAVMYTSTTEFDRFEFDIDNVEIRSARMQYGHYYSKSKADDWLITFSGTKVMGRIKDKTKNPRSFLRIYKRDNPYQLLQITTGVASLTRGGKIAPKVCIGIARAWFNGTEIRTKEGSCRVPVEFNVDMNEQNITADDNVYVYSASFGAHWSEYSQPMTDPDGDGIYSTTVLVTSNSEVHYYFKKNSVREKLSGMSCADSMWYHRRTAQIVEMPVAVGPFCFNKCSPFCSVTELKLVKGYHIATFTVNMERRTESNGKVCLYGSTLGNRGIPMSNTLGTSGAKRGKDGLTGANARDKNGMSIGNKKIFSVSLVVRDYTYFSYQFVDNCDLTQSSLMHMGDAENIGEGGSCTEGPTGLRYFHMQPRDIVLPTACFGACLICSTKAPAETPGLDESASKAEKMDGTKSNTLGVVVAVLFIVILALAAVGVGLYFLWKSFRRNRHEAKYAGSDFTSLNEHEQSSEYAAMEDDDEDDRGRGDGTQTLL